MKRTFGTFVATALILSPFSSCKTETQQTQVEELPVVNLYTATSEVVADEEDYSSNVLPWAKNNIAPQSANRIESLLVEVGDYVTAGQIIARMDDVQLRQSELQVSNDKLEYDRLKTLRDQGGISQSDFDSFELACNVHKSSYENILKNTVLRSPLNGVITARNFDRGDMYSMTQPIYVVEQIIPVKMLVGLSESDYTRVKKGDVATISVDAFPDRTFKGVITNIYPTIDVTTHTFTVEVKASNTDRKLRPGMYAKVRITFGTGRKVLVQDKCVVKQQGSGDRYVYLFNAADSTVSYTKVRLGARLDNRYVILDGVSEGDQIVNEGQLRLKDGVKVKVK